MINFDSKNLAMGNRPSGEKENGRVQTVIHLRDAMERLERHLTGLDAAFLDHAKEQAKGFVSLDSKNEFMLNGAHVRCSRFVGVLSGPCVGAVTETSVRLRLEIDAPAEVTCYVSKKDQDTPKGRLVASKTISMIPGIPGTFRIDGLCPGERYCYCFGGLRRRDAVSRVGRFRTWGGRNRSSVRIALVGSNGWSDVERDAVHFNAWEYLADVVTEESEGVQLALHLGDQVCGVGHEMTTGVWHSKTRRRLERRMATDQYRCTLNMSHARTVFANCSNLTVCGDGDRALGRFNYCRYQYKLREGVSDENDEESDEFHHAHVLGPLAIFCMHLQGANRWAGEARDSSRPLISDAQISELEALLERDDIRLVVLTTSAPIVEYSQVEIDTLRTSDRVEHGRWSSPESKEITNRVLERLFAWKRVGMRRGRDVIVVCGGVPVSVETTIRDPTMEVSLMQYAVGPIGASPSSFMPALEGSFGRYQFVHRPRSLNRSFGVLTLEPYNATGPSQLNVPMFAPPVASFPWPLWPAVRSHVRWRDAYVDVSESAPSHLELLRRSEERRVGKECRSRWSPYH